MIETREHYRADGTCDCDLYGDGLGHCTGCGCCDWEGSVVRPDAPCADLHCPCGDAGATADGTCDCGVGGDGLGHCRGCECCDWEGSVVRPDAPCAALDAARGE